MVLNGCCRFAVFLIFVFVGIKEKYRRTRLNVFFVYFTTCFADSLLATLYIVMRIMYRRNVLKYHDGIFLSYRPALVETKRKCLITWFVSS